MTYNPNHRPYFPTERIKQQKKTHCSDADCSVEVEVRRIVTAPKILLYKKRENKRNKLQNCSGKIQSNGLKNILEEDDEGDDEVDEDEADVRPKEVS